MLTNVAGRVWLLPYDPDPDNVRPSVAVIAGDRGSVVVDAGHSPAHAREVQDAMRHTGLPAARWLVYTHHHWDHTWGACAWSDVEIVGHASGHELLQQEAARPWSHRYLRDQVRANPLLGRSFRARALAMDTWDGFTILPPHRTFTDELDLPTGVRVRHVGGRHAPDSTVVLVPDSGVALLGDCFYPPPWHLRAPDDGLDRPLLGSLLREGGDDYQWYVAAHEDPSSLDQMRGMR